MTTIDTTTTITDQLDELARSLGDVPGKHPQDSQIACALLSLVLAGIHSGYPASSSMLLNTLERRGCDRHEAEELAQALTGLALRLGAWLGRDAR